LRISYTLISEFNLKELFIMKNVLVFDVENVLFNVNYVKGALRRRDENLIVMDEFEKSYGERSREKYLDESFKKVKLYKKVREGVKDLIEIKRRMGGKVKVYVVSEFKNEWVWRLMRVNGMSVDGVFGSIEKFKKEVDIEGKDVVYFSGVVERVNNGEEIGVKSVLCKWGKKYGKRVEGICEEDEMLREIGIRKNVENNEKKEEEVVFEESIVESVEVEVKEDNKINEEEVVEEGRIEVKEDERRVVGVNKERELRFDLIGKDIA